MKHVVLADSISNTAESISFNVFIFKPKFIKFMATELVTDL